MVSKCTALPGCGGCASSAFIAAHHPGKWPPPRDPEIAPDTRPERHPYLLAEQARKGARILVADPVAPAATVSRHRIYDRSGLAGKRAMRAFSPGGREREPLHLPALDSRRLPSSTSMGS